MRAAAYVQHAARYAAVYEDVCSPVAAGKDSGKDREFLRVREAHLAERPAAAAVRERLGLGEAVGEIEVTDGREYRTPYGRSHPDLRA